MKTIIEDIPDDKGGPDRGGADYAEAVNIWDSPKLQGWLGYQFILPRFRLIFPFKYSVLPRQIFDIFSVK